MLFTPPIDPAIPFVHAELERVTAVEALASDLNGRDFAQVHTAQISLLQALLQKLGGEVDPSPSASSTAPRQATPAAMSDLLKAEGAALDQGGRTELASAPPKVARLLLVSSAQRASAYELLGGKLGGWPPTTPTPEAGEFLYQGLHSARYGLEVAAAKAPVATRAPIAAALDTVLREERALSRYYQPRPELGYSLPFELQGPADAVRLAITVLDSLIEAVLWQAPKAVGLQAPKSRPLTSSTATVPATTAGSPQTNPVDAAPMSTLLRLMTALNGHRLACGGPWNLLPLLGAQPTSSSSSASPPA
ncbi:hypothetical protein [Gephyromycinifex aptenodytis]|uniref:hypothetical protein n=1 Tax=Gephyromycinifex aptenodytis TaxID=2716227 RepID=UPI0014458406|nr:hypothetical protein [Gephyromycinifex aptenodytis]